MRGVELDRMSMCHGDFMLGVKYESTNDTTCDLVWKHYTKYYIYWCSREGWGKEYGSFSINEKDP